MDKQQLTCQLAIWHASENTRELPWKGEKDAYKIWLSEIILQQTRAGMGKKYYEAFSNRYPTIKDLADAPDEEVFKMWEGLGYYTRCRNLLATARHIANDLHGVFPQTYEQILALRGVGPYTAAAISSFAFNLPHAVVDGNVFRVLARCFGINTPIDSPEGKKIFTKLADEVLDTKNPAAHNQAMMDFGAVVCKPISPLCDECPMQNGCAAYKQGTVNELPVKAKLKARKDRWFTYFIISVDGKTLVHQRSQKDIWQQLFEFYLVETGAAAVWTEENVTEFLAHRFSVQDAGIRYISPELSQQLTHQTVHAVFIKVVLPRIPETLSAYLWIDEVTRKQLPFPKIINEYLNSTSFPATLF